MDYVFKSVDIDLEYPRGERKSADTYESYIKQLPVELARKLFEVYRKDFELFDYQKPS